MKSQLVWDEIGTFRCRFIHIHGISIESRLQKAIPWPSEASTLQIHALPRYDIDHIFRGTSGGDGNKESPTRQPERTRSSVHKLNSNVNSLLSAFWPVEGCHGLSASQLDMFPLPVLSCQVPLLILFIVYAYINNVAQMTRIVRTKKGIKRDLCYRQNI